MRKSDHDVLPDQGADNGPSLRCKLEQILFIPTVTPVLHYRRRVVVVVEPPVLPVVPTIPKSAAPLCALTPRLWCRDDLDDLESVNTDSKISAA